MLAARNVRGRFRSLRHGANAILVAILIGVPWIRIAGEPLVLLDLPARRFHVFGLVIVPQELYLLWLLIVGAALALFLFTALGGRVWCGWACPQTVFTDLYAISARWIQGWRGMVAPKHVAAWRKVATHALWLLVSAVVGFHLVAYFVTPGELLNRLAGNSSAGAARSFVVFASLVAYVDFVFVKQAFCTTLCPYARFQSVLFDRDTLVVGYDARRGEPRGKRGTTEGDCVDCGLCVQVCPTNIDIRDGLQLECITCTQCIDACNGVMERVGREANLIGYRSLSSLDEGRAARVLRPRVVVYGALLAAFVASFVVVLAQRNPMDLMVTHNREALFGRAADGRYGNAFTLRVENRDRSEHLYRLRLQDDGAAFTLVAGQNPIPVGPSAAVEARVFVMAPDEWVPGNSRTPFRFVLERADGEARDLIRETHFLTPEVIDAG